MKGLIVENHYTADGALYQGDEVSVFTFNQQSKTYRVETKDGKLYTVPKKVLKLLDN